jgi:hypothetical protein
MKLKLSELGMEKSYMKPWCTREMVKAEDMGDFIELLQIAETLCMPTLLKEARYSCNWRLSFTQYGTIRSRGSKALSMPLIRKVLEKILPKCKDS